MNLIQALAAGRQRGVVQKTMSPSQALGGMFIDSQPAPVSKIDPERAIREGFKANVFAYACVRRLASAGAQAEWKVYRRTGDGGEDWEPDTGDWRTKLLAYPNDKLSSSELHYYALAWLAINGNGLLRSVEGGAHGILELWPMSPVRVEPIAHPVDWVSGYRMVEDGKMVWQLPAERAIHARLPDPSNPLWGYGMMDAAWTSINSDTASRKLRDSLYTNGGVPPAAITDESLTSDTVLQESAAVLKRAWRQNAKDRVPMLLPKGTAVLNFGFSASDMEIPEDRQLTRDEIVTAFGMLPAMFSTAASTYDNVRTAIRYMYDNGVAELLGLLRDALNLSLLTPDERAADDVWITYDLSEAPFFRAERQAKIEDLGKAIRSGISRNDAVSMLDLGLEKAEGGDAVFIESGLTLLSEAADGVSSESAAGTPGFPPPFAPVPPTPTDPTMTDAPAPAPTDAPPTE